MIKQPSVICDLIYPPLSPTERLFLHLRRGQTLRPKRLKLLISIGEAILIERERETMKIVHKDFVPGGAGKVKVVFSLLVFNEFYAEAKIGL